MVEWTFVLCEHFIHNDQANIYSHACGNLVDSALLTKNVKNHFLIVLNF